VHSHQPWIERPSRAVSVEVVSPSGFAHLVWTSDDFGKLAFLLILTFDDGFNDGRMIAPEVHKDVGDAILPQSLEEGKRCRIAVSRLVSISIAKEEQAYTMFATLLPLRSYFGIAVSNGARGRVWNVDKAHPRRRWHDCSPRRQSRSWVMPHHCAGKTSWLGKGAWRPRRLSTTDGFQRLTATFQSIVTDQCNLRRHDGCAKNSSPPLFGFHSSFKNQQGVFASARCVCLFVSRCWPWA
jgi:hypothetical protein